MNKLQNSHKKFNQSIDKMASIFHEYKILLRDMDLPESKVSEVSLIMVALFFANLLANDINRGILKKQYLELFLKEQVYDETLSILSKMQQKGTK